MAYQSLYRRYRPQRFGELRGQDHLVRGLRNAVRDGRIGDAYLFSGPRGTGKTSTARILAKALNCEHVVDGEPCGECESCVAIEHGASFDVFELDAASNNGVEAVRELIGKAALGTPGRTKVYILDEVHMLSTPASNALLKTLEEPPPHVVFVLATTDPQKVLPTIKSRTQHFRVNLLPAAELEALVRDVSADAGLDVNDEAVEFVVRAGGGSARDTLSALDQVVAAGEVPGSAETLDDLVEALCDRDTGRALLAIDAAIGEGGSPRDVGEQLMARLRDVFLASVGSELASLPDGPAERVRDQAGRLTPAGATRALETLGDAFVGIQDAPDPRITLEVALVRLTRPEVDTSIEALLDRVTRLEHAVGQGINPAPPPTSRPPAAPASTPSGSGPEVEPEVPRAGGSPAGGRPADGARQALAAKKAGSAPRSAPSRPASPRPQIASMPETVPTPDSGASEPRPSSSSDAPSDLPSKDELTLAWGDSILSGLGRAKPRYAGGRWISVDDGVAVYGLPNKIHAAKCDQVRPEVEGALEAHFGRPVPVRIVVDNDAQPPIQPTGRRSETDEPSGEDDVDLSGLVDAGSSASSSADRVAEVFPGAELVDGD